jgi:hypothetical protein
MGRFEDIDLNRLGVISRDEIRQRLMELNDGRLENDVDFIVDNLLITCDFNDDGAVSPIEMMVCQYISTDMLHHVATPAEVRTIYQYYNECFRREAIWLS